VPVTAPRVAPAPVWAAWAGRVGAAGGRTSHDGLRRRVGRRAGAWVGRVIRQRRRDRHRGIQDIALAGGEMVSRWHFVPVHGLRPPGLGGLSGRWSIAWWSMCALCARGGCRPLEYPTADRALRQADTLRGTQKSAVAPTVSLRGGATTSRRHALRCRPGRVCRRMWAAGTDEKSVALAMNEATLARRTGCIGTVSVHHHRGRRARILP
jgi:hypothetical protein